MSTVFTFQVAPCGAVLEIERNIVLPDTWTDTADVTTLVVGSGFVDSSEPTKLICHSGPDDNAPVLTLIGANWNSRPGDTGSATCDLCTSTPSDQTWTLNTKY